MPILIQQWLPTLAPPILASWELIKEALIARFGVSAEVDNQRLLKDLKRCKKGAQESIRLHATKWEHLLSLISEEYTEDTKINLFIQSLDKPETRLTLIAIQVALKLDTVAKVIQQAIDLEVKARLTEQPETLDNTPMDVDAFQRAHSHHQYSHQNKANGKPRNKSYEQVPRSSNKYVQLRAYDKFGNPICDICHNKHRTVDCNQYRSNKSSSNKPVYNKNKKYNQQNQHCCKHSYFLYDISCIKINDDTQKD
ncbi:hypothetical protein G6F57_016238 [Rhizopus arrhizus]|uniref:Retrotransposon gag domain-containing protein n=1 Tax=Rhizopus oryzae TaxID=64495 RepID=A0A9P7BKY0_RHIOR|nr:hypothetical protein G6F23_013025 [Rhizopus arrhizus]KAG1392209.1 hypothetical protein G6F58_012557 [Rhizopus delemar]KAG0752500.1 hypothetical protein G6F24_013540 [Rhizopus arrhizus]KAG0771750.1 hypothetical protein G6F22_016224 [Rhizopus arrhizus]KAG0778055.1 hypothetical protein G6F21_013137 [Rhizopus arrhizus]